jgi:hypothetical protein
MALRDKLTRRAVPFMEPGEQIQAIFTAQSGASPCWAVISARIALLTSGYATVVVTDRAILVLRNGWFSGTRARSLLARLPRRSLDDPSGRWATLHLGEARYWVHRRFHKDIRAANAAIMGAAPTGYGRPGPGALRTPTRHMRHCRDG